MPEDGTPAPDPLLAGIAERLRRIRKSRGLTRKALAAHADVSERYLAQLEGATGNASVTILARIADALGTRLRTLVDPPDALAEALNAAPAKQRAEISKILTPGAHWGGRIALIGLRGAGKSTLGSMLASHLDLPFEELNARIGQEAGIPSGEVIALYGEAAYRRRERSALTQLAEGPPLVLAVAGGIVADAQTYELLLDRFLTVWIQADSEDHMARVRAQGDERPMRGNPQAMAELKAILAARTPAYGRAELTVQTSGNTVQASLDSLLQGLSPFLDL